MPIVPDHLFKNKKRKYDRDRDDGDSKEKEKPQEEEDPLANATTLYVGNLCVLNDGQPNIIPSDFD